LCEQQHMQKWGAKAKIMDNMSDQSGAQAQVVWMYDTKYVHFHV